MPGARAAVFVPLPVPVKAPGAAYEQHKGGQVTAGVGNMSRDEVYGAVRSPGGLVRV
jgi:hypothetical protein